MRVPGFNELLRADSCVRLMLEPFLEVSVFIKISKSAEPQFPGLHIARWDADRHALQAFSVQALFVEGFLDVLVPSLKAGVIGIYRDQQADRLAGVLPEESNRDFQTGEHKGKTAFLSSPRCDPDAVPAERLLENRTKKLLVPFVLTEQKTPQLVWHVRPRGR